ncbi:MAG: hypothetical protein AAF560_27575 [Acidobacteriota bacterium]
MRSSLTFQPVRRWGLSVGLGGICWLLVACDSGPSAPDTEPLLPDFSCAEVSPCSLTCTDRTTGGRRPYQLLWQADDQASTSVINPTFIWVFPAETLVRVRLTVVEDDGRGERAGPLEKLFEICAGDASLGNDAGQSAQPMARNLHPWPREFLLRTDPAEPPGREESI